MTVKIPETMQAVQLDKEGGQLIVRQIPVPKPGAGEVLVRIAASTINPSDIGFIAGGFGYTRTLPVTPGIEGSGTVVTAGSGWLGKFLLGRRVACTKSPTYNGTWAEYMVTRASLCIPLQKTISLEQGSTLVVNPMTAVIFLDMIRKGKYKAVVNSAAASQLGRMLVRLSLKHNFPLINVVRRGEQAELLRSMGARYVLVSTDADFDEKLTKLTHELNATLVLEAIGGDFTQRLIDASPEKSLILLYSNLSAEPATIRPNSLWNYDRRVEGFYLGTWARKNSVLKVLQIAQQAQKLLSADLQVTFQKRLPLSAVQEGLEMYRKNMTAGKILLVIDPKEVSLKG